MDIAFIRGNLLIIIQLDTMEHYENATITLIQIVVRMRPVSMGWQGNGMLKIIRTSIFESPAQTMVNTVNTVGVMGKGIAKEFKARYPAMFREYKRLCNDRVLEPGVLHLWRGSKWVLNFPTKITWKKPSQISYVEDGLKTFVQHYEAMGIRSISFPPLGCGNGNLDWDEVRPLMLHYLWELPIQVYIHDWHVGAAFRPEHNELEASLPPVTFNEFVADLQAAIQEKNGRFRTIWKNTPYTARLGNDGTLEIFTDLKNAIGQDFLVNAWVGLQTGLLTPKAFGDITAQKAAGYLIPLLAELSYVNYTIVEPDPSDPHNQIGLFFNSASDGFDDFSVAA